MSEIRDVRAVFPHPTRAAMALVTAPAGVWCTDDSGANWRELPALQAATLGPVTDIAFRPGYPDTLVFAAAASGLWISMDAGASVTRLGTAATGLAADGVATVCFYPADPTFRTLLAGHGAAKDGLSRTTDLGRTWSTLYPGCRVHQLLVGRPGTRELYAVGSRAAEPDRTDLYYAPSVGQFWSELLTDILPADAAVAVNARDVYLATFDTGLYRVGQRGGRSEPLTPDAARWDSVDAGWGAHADEERLCLYDSRKLGAVLAPRSLTPRQPAGRGLYAGNFVRDGARVRTNAGSTRFYAAINGTLYTGRNRAAFRVEDVTVTPGTLTVSAYLFSESRWQQFDRDLQTFWRSPSVARMAQPLLDQLATFREAVPDDRLQLTARVTSPADKPPTAVTVDLSRLGRSPRTPMLDDGQHGDGATGDGVFGVSVPLDRRGLVRRDGDWRCGAPGRLGLTVSAVAPDRTLAGAVGVLALYFVPDTLTIFAEHEWLAPRDAQGEVRLETVRDRTLAATGEACLRLTVGPGPWQAPIGIGDDTWNVTGFHALGFSIRAGDRAGGTVRVHLRDAPLYAPPTLTPGLDLVADGLLPGGTIPDDRYVRVVVPLARLVDPAGQFLPEFLSAIVFSGDNQTPRTYLLDDIRVFLTGEEAEADAKGGQAP